MNQRLHSLLAEAEAQLAPEDQERLAEMLEAFVANNATLPDFTPEELEHLRMIEAEPFVAADPAEVAAYFARGK